MIPWIKSIARRTTALFRSRSLESRLDQELQFHLEMQIEENQKSGMDSEAARNAALRSMGGIDRARENSRDARSFRLAEDFSRDLRFALRIFWRKPKFAFAAVIILALAIGPNTAFFSVLKGVMFRYMPYPDSDRLVEIWNANPRQGITMSSISYADFQDCVKLNHSLESTAYYVETSVNFTGAGEPERAPTVRATSSLFPLLKRDPVRGRFFGSREEKTESAVIISYRLWQRKFFGDPAIIGKIISLDYLPRTIIGVMPEDFVFPDTQYDLWLPFNFDAELAKITANLAERKLGMAGSDSTRNFRPGTAIARLKSGVALKNAQADFSRIAAILETAYPATNKGLGILVQDYSRIGMPRNFDALVQLLIMAVAFLLLIACANISTLLLARSTGRKKEIAIRGSIGGSRMRLMRQMFTESLLLALLGGGAGVFVAFIWVKGIIAITPLDMPNRDRIGIDAVSLIYTTGIAIFSSLVFGVIPALRSTGRRAMEAIKEGSHASAGRYRHRLLNGFVVAETAMAALLLISSGLLVRSYRNQISLNPGFDRKNLLAIYVSMPESKYGRPEQLAAFVENAAAKLKKDLAIPIVAAAQKLPLDDSSISYRGPFSVQGQFLQQPGQSPMADMLPVTPDYFRTLRIPLLRGRHFTDSDRQANPVAIVNEAMVKCCMGKNANPLGGRIKIGNFTDSKQPWMEIVGVVRNTDFWFLAQPQWPQIYIPYAQQPSRNIAFIARTEKAPMEYAAAARKLIWSIDPEQPVSSIRTMEQIIDDRVSSLRAGSQVSSAVSLFALALAALGIYGVISYIVSERTNEIGIRMAFGADRGDICRMFLVRGMGLLAIGLVIGVAGALACMRLIRNLLFGVTPVDLISYSIGGIVLLLAGALAILLPARRAMTVDPMTSIRHE